MTSTRRFGQYELLSKVGAGGMAEIFLARSIGAEGLEKRLVIKRILPDFAQQQEFVSMFIDEAKLAVSLNHANIVQVYEFGKVSQDYYLAMEYVEGMDLAQLLQRLRTAGVKLPLGEAIYIAQELCKGLDYAHRKTDQFGEKLHIVHRDISPHNLLVSSDGAIKIVDFGIARTREATPESDEIIRGKFSYMSPEQALGGHLDHRSDLFAAGLVLFESIYGRPLFEFTSREESMQLIRGKLLPDLSTLSPAIPDAVASILICSLNRIPDKRFESARKMQIELTRVLFSLGEIYDAQTLADFVQKIEKTLPPRTTLQPLDQKTAHHISHAQVEPPNEVNNNPTVSGMRVSIDLPSDAFKNTEKTSELIRQDAIQREKKSVICIHGSFSTLPSKQPFPSQRDPKDFNTLQSIVEAIAFKNKAHIEDLSPEGFHLILGLPISGENDAENAVWMALDLIEAVEGLSHNAERPVGLSIGVALGNLLIQREKDSKRLSHQHLGSVIGLAKQITKDAAPSQIVIVGHIYQRVRRAFVFELLERIQHDEDERYGKGNPKLYTFKHPKTPEEKRSELRESRVQIQGRDLELKGLQNQLRSVLLERKARGIWIEGDAGIGKSTLLELFLQSFKGRKLTTQEYSNRPLTLHVQALHLHKEDPYGLIKEILLQLLRLPSPSTPDVIAERIETQISSNFPLADPNEHIYLVQSLGHFFGIEYSNSLIEALSTSRRHIRVMYSMRRLLQNFTQIRPLVLAVEDIHLGDPSSVNFIHSILSEQLQRPLLFLATSRLLDSNTPQAIQILRESEGITIEHLQPLNAQEAVALLQDQFASNIALSPEAIQHLLDRAGGNPFFLLELVDAMQQRGDLIIVNEQLTLASSSAEPWLPSGIEAVVAAKIDRLDPELKLALQQCSILGEVFERREIEPLFGASFLPKIATLIQQQLLTPSREKNSGLLRFTQTLTYEVTLRGLLWEERKDWHGLIADRLIHRLKETPPPSSAIIARHLEGAGRGAEAIAFLLQAADRAQGSHCHAEALRFLDRSLRLIPPESPTRHQILSQKERALDAQGRNEERLETLNEMHRFAKKYLSIPEQISVELSLARYLFDLGKIHEACDAVTQVISHARTHHLSNPEAQAARLNARLMGRAGDVKAAAFTANAALSSFRKLKDYEQQAQTLKLLGDLHWQLGQYTQSVASFEEVLSLSSAGQDIRERASFNLGVSLMSMGRYEQGLVRFEEALSSARAVGFRKREAEILPNIGYACYLVGEPKRAASVLLRGVRLSRSVRSKMVRADALLSLSFVAVELEQPQRAKGYLKEGLALATHVQSNYLQTYISLGLARLALEQEVPDLERATKLILKALELGNRSSLSHALTLGHHLMSLVEERRGNTESSYAHSAKVMSMLRTREITEQEIMLYEQSLLHQRLDPEELNRAEDFLERAASKVRIISRTFLTSARRRTYLQRPPIRSILDAVPGLASLLNR